MRTVVENLIENAIRYNAAESWIRVTVTKGECCARLEVENAGPRVLPEEVERLTEPLYRAQSVTQNCRLSGTVASESDGYGLGLALVQAITRRFDADLSITAREESGLRVRVDWPAIQLGQHGPS